MSNHTAASPVTKHSCNGPVFGKLTPGCARCEELKAGKPAVRWNVRKQSRYSGGSYVQNYCCCGKSNLWDGRCASCGKSVYTD